jgi:hypothetical protein
MPPPSVLRVYRKTFDTFDIHKTGKVHVTDLGGAAEAIRNVGVGQDGIISFEEFVFMMEHSKISAHTVESDDEADEDNVVVEFDHQENEIVSAY